ncbi:ectoine utilization protein EutC [Roseibium sp. TrichSKD4]|uniref:cyclodeaminase n=1 Tax=Roseibium sp. TrichSKD4 TaxID=744980 RepID=UPI0001E573CF|nr:cyclodeaminase [Roseibium sp. TrichSKD4]EFO29819.1 ectoine utilization protein EutC [Roseibium sp. TrichSKD4]
MVHDIQVVTEQQLRGAVHLDLAAIDCVENAFAKLASGTVVMPPVLSMALRETNAEVDVKTAYVPGLEGFAIKVSPGFFNNPSIGLPSLNGLMILFSAKTGMVEAVFLDNGYLTDVRTAAAGAVAARHLAPKSVMTAGVMGTGVQARLQLEAARLVRPFKQALVWGRSKEKAEATANDLEKCLGIPVSAESDPEKLVRESQLVVTTTPATTPILKADWLHEGLHITAMGSDQEDKNELDPACFSKADLTVCDRISQCEVMGELRSALSSGMIKETGEIAEIGQVIAGTHNGRQSESDITLCDLTGTGVQDTAIATYTRTLLAGSNVVTTITV